MYTYNHHIGDFDQATRHLTRVERSLYRDAIEMYYDTEKPLPKDNFELLARKLLAKSDEERAGLQTILDEFFTDEEDGFHNKRCDWEIEKFHRNLEIKSRAGQASAAARKKKKGTPVKQKLTHVKQTLNSRSTNEQLTKSLKPKTNNINKRTSKTSLPENFSISDRVKDWASKKGIYNLEDHLEYFINTVKSNGNKYLDWDAALMKAITGDWAKIGFGSPPNSNSNFVAAR